MTNRTRWAEQKLNYSFSDPTLLEYALTHRSASKLNNERLEFLGDACLNFVVAQRLFELCPSYSEGDLSRARASLVNGSTLATLAREISLDSQIIVGRGERRSGGASKGSVLADALEALIGAVLLDGKHAQAEALVLRLYGERFLQLPDPLSLKDSKTRLQEFRQGRGESLPVYTVKKMTGKDHQKSFTVKCELDGGEKSTHGIGSSRRNAEQEAAAAMLTELQSE